MDFEITRQAHRGHLSACLTRLADRLILDDGTMPPPMIVPGHRPSHE
jgi:hypothetical protein